MSSVKCIKAVKFSYIRFLYCAIRLSFICAFQKEIFGKNTGIATFVTHDAKMNIKRPTKMASEPYAIWKEKPPGPEQKELDRMFACNEVDSATTPDTIRKSNKLFQKFSANIFGAHFRKTKAKYGLSAAVPQDEGGSGAIPELGLPETKFSAQQSAPQSSPIDNDKSIQFENAPYCTWTYTNHEKKCDYVCVALPIISGSRNMKYVLSEDGMKITVHYTWPSAIHNPHELFSEAIKEKRISAEHPKVHAFVSQLLESGITQKSSPRGQIIIDLPTQVKRETGSSINEGITFNDTKIVLLEFMAYQKALIVDEDDTTIEFN